MDYWVLRPTIFRPTIFRTGYHITIQHIFLHQSIWLHVVFRIVGPLCTILLNKTCHRVVGIAGGSMCCAGILISAFAPNCHFLFFSLALYCKLIWSLYNQSYNWTVHEHPKEIRIKSIRLELKIELNQILIWIEFFTLFKKWFKSQIKKTFIAVFKNLYLSHRI